METIGILLAAATIVFLGRVGFILYEVLAMDFDFNRPWPKEQAAVSQVQKPKAPVALNARREEKINVVAATAVSR